MKYNYEFWVDSRSGEVFRIKLPVDLGIVSGFLEAEIRTNAGAKLITDIMDKILFGQEEYFDWYGNVYRVEIVMVELSYPLVQ